MNETEWWLVGGMVALIGIIYRTLDRRQEAMEKKHDDLERAVYDRPTLLAMSELAATVARKAETREVDRLSEQVDRLTTNINLQHVATLTAISEGKSEVERIVRDALTDRYKR